MNLKSLFIATLAIGFSAAWADEMDDLMKQSVPQDGPVLATFKSTRIINMPSTQIAGPGDLNFYISHHLGPLSTGTAQAFGLDMAKIRLAFEYGINDWVQVGVGRTNGGYKPVDGTLKIRLLRQSLSGSMPVSVTGQAAAFYATAPDSSVPFDLTAQRRFSSVEHLMVGRKFGEKFSAELMSAVVIRNLYPTASDHLATGIIGVGGRYKLSQRYAVTWDFATPIPPNSNGDYYSPVFGIGFDLDTGGHVFQLYLCNSPWLNDDRLLVETGGALGDQGTAMRLGFQLNRTFSL